jgi:hypothetical protein
MLACLTLVILPLLLPLLAHGAAILLSVAALASEPVPLDPWHAATVRPSVAAQAATRSAPCKVAVDRQERRAYPRPVIPGPVRMERFRYSACAAPSLTVPSVL